MNSIVWLMIISTSVWVYFDATKIGARRGLIKGFFNLGPFSWAAACILLWIVSFPAYLIQRPKIIEAASGQTSSGVTISGKVRQSGLNTMAKFIAIGWTIFCGIFFFSALADLGSTAPTSGNQFEEAGFAIGATLGFGMWLVVWAVIAIPAAVTFLLTRKSGPVIIEQPQVVEQGRTKPCPYCAELIKEDAIFCRHCRHDLQPAVEPEPPPAIAPPPPPQPAPDWIARGRDHLKGEEIKEAIAALTKAIEQQPDGEAYYLRAVAYSKMKDREKMVADLKEAAKLGHEKAMAALAKMG